MPVLVSRSPTVKASILFRRWDGVGKPVRCCFCGGAGLGRMTKVDIATATAKSRDGVGNDWIGRTSVPLALLLLAFHRAWIGSQIEEAYTDRVPDQEE